MDNVSAAPSPRTLALTIGAIGVVYGDIGTSPLYAFREALNQAESNGATVGAPEILGILSLALWSLILVVTIKYVLFLTRADNHGEGGVLSLMALANRATAGRWPVVLVLGGLGAALFYGDAIITPALSVLSAVEGLKSVPGIGDAMTLELTLAITVGILTGLFAIQSRGTASMGRLFGPVCTIWFLAIGGLGVWHIAGQPGVLAALNPTWGIQFLTGNGMVGLIVLGAVFLTVTGAEALIADMGHFGRRPIQLGWLTLVWPALTLNYMGQGALALSTLEAAGGTFTNADWFFLMAPGEVRVLLVALATAATIIASQAVITGAYSLTKQAIALGLLPRMMMLQTSAEHSGQIYMPAVNWLLFVGVLMLVLAFQTSSAMAVAYGIAVTGTMVVTTCLAFVVLWKAWDWPLPWVVLVVVPFLILDIVFLGANALRIAEGGWVPLLVAAAIGIVIATWHFGRRAATKGMERQTMPISELAASFAKRPPHIVDGTAVFLTQSNDDAPSALLHNLKHSKALHARNMLLSVEIATVPSVSQDQRLTLDPVDDRFTRAKLSYGYMDSIDVPSDLARGYPALTQPGGTSFYVGRNTIRRARKSRLPRWMIPIYAFLHRNAADPTLWFGIPPNRVVELGAQVEL